MKNNNQDSLQECQKLELKQLCIDLNSNFNSIHEKKNINLIKRQLNKKKKIKKTSKSLFYQNELSNLLNNIDIYSSEPKLEKSTNLEQVLKLIEYLIQQFNGS